MALKNNTWKINQWYDQSVAGNVSYSGAAALFAWGINEKGQLGQNEGGNPAPKYSSPVQIPGTTWAFVSNDNTGGDALFVLGTKTDGTFWSWGANEDGQLGLNSKAVHSSPVQVPGTTWGYPIAVGHKSSYAIKTDGTFWSWGYNSAYGALGHNNKTQYSSPIQVGSETTWSSLALMGYGAMATKTDGTLWTWGAGSHGMGAQNNKTGYSSPRQVPGTTWNKVSGAGQFGASIKTDGSLWMWGVNEYGMLGQNSVIYRSSPIQVGSETTWSNIGCNSKGISAVKTDGTLWVWGSNADGRLGLNEAEAPGALGRSSPTQIPGTTWNNVVGGKQNNMATKTDGSLWMWGPNSYGSLGQNNIIAYSSPVQVPGSWNSGDGKFSHIHFGTGAIANI